MECTIFSIIFLTKWPQAQFWFSDFSPKSMVINGCVKYESDMSIGVAVT